ncbi:MAG: hypothetical protein B6I20_13150, partial [Bacteroidetes bacterium 4572_117]
KITDVDLNSKTVKTESGDEYTYDKLVFATGSKVVIPSFIPGYNLDNVFYIKKSYNYIKQLHIDLKSKQNIVVIGGGFIGAEVAEQLALNIGKKVTLIESENYCFSKAFSKELSKIATEALGNTNVQVKTSVRVKELKGKNNKVDTVILENNEEISCDAVIMAIGYKPNTELAKDCGLQLNRIGAIVKDNYERTKEKGVCAVGDCSQTIGFLTGRSDHVMLASTATAEARVLGHNIFGVKMRKAFMGTLAVFSTEIDGLAMAAAGINDSSAKETNIDYLSAKFTDFDTHPGKFSHSKQLSVKLFASAQDGSILGGEVWGGKSAGEIINTISLAIQKGVTVFEMVSFQIGSHPLLTSAPTKTHLIKAAEGIIAQMK